MDGRIRYSTHCSYPYSMISFHFRVNTFTQVLDAKRKEKEPKREKNSALTD